MSNNGLRATVLVGILSLVAIYHFCGSIFGLVGAALIVTAYAIKAVSVLTKNSRKEKGTF